MWLTLPARLLTCIVWALCAGDAYALVERPRVATITTVHNNKLDRVEEAYVNDTPKGASFTTANVV